MSIHRLCMHIWNRNRATQMVEVYVRAQVLYSVQKPHTFSANVHLLWNATRWRRGFRNQLNVDADSGSPIQQPKRDEPFDGATSYLQHHQTYLVRAQKFLPWSKPINDTLSFCNIQFLFRTNDCVKSIKVVSVLTNSTSWRNSSKCAELSSFCAMDLRARNEKSVILSTFKNENMGFLGSRTRYNL